MAQSSCRFDKVDPYGGSFRAKLAFAVASTDVGVVYPVGLDASGNVVKGAGQTSVVGVICPVRTAAIGEPIDVMVDGEIANFALQNGSAAQAGTVYYGHADGTLSTLNTDTKLGWTVTADRLMVHVMAVKAVQST